jgi:hypothetical protein
MSNAVETPLVTPSGDGAIRSFINRVFLSQAEKSRRRDLGRIVKKKL